jgi:hypothetical protein
MRLGEGTLILGFWGKYLPDSSLISWWRHAVGHHLWKMCLSWLRRGKDTTHDLCKLWLRVRNLSLLSSFWTFCTNKIKRSGLKSWKMQMKKLKHQNLLRNTSLLMVKLKFRHQLQPQISA